MNSADGDHTGAGGHNSGRRAYRMGTRQEAVDRTREAILQATYDLWLAQPYDEVTVEAVADAAGVSRQTVHRQFGSKHDLVMAVTRWHGPREDLLREVAPGDVGAAVACVCQRYEEMGDGVMRLLELEGRLEAVDYALAQGRASHRAWVEQVFAPYLPRRGRARERLVLALYAATDVSVWKILRRDLGRSAPDTQAAVGLLVEGAVGLADESPEGSL